MFSPIMQMMKSFLIVLVITLSTISINIFGMTVGMLVSSIDLITNLFSPIENLGMELQTIQKSMAAIEIWTLLECMRLVLKMLLL